jgi:hypothetical protein
MLIERLGGNNAVDFNGIPFTSKFANQMLSFTMEERQTTL